MILNHVPLEGDYGHRSQFESKDWKGDRVVEIGPTEGSLGARALLGGRSADGHPTGDNTPMAPTAPKPDLAIAAGAYFYPSATSP